MSQYIQQKYVGLLSTQLRNFQSKGKGNSCFTHECERRESRKRRGYFLPYNQNVIFKCHNCGQSMSFGNFLKHHNPGLYKDYCLEMFREGVWKTEHPPETEELPVQSPLPEQYARALFGLIKITDLTRQHPARAYVDQRKIPLFSYRKWYVAPKFYFWAKQFDSVFEKFTSDHPRLIIPYYSKEGKILGFACRAFKNEQPKYIILRLDKSQELIYGMDTVDTNKQIIALEGQVDSVFLENAIAVGRADYSSEFLKAHKDNVVIVPDNDFRRNKQVCDQLSKAIRNDFRVCFLPSVWKKDINAIVKDGIKPEEIMRYIQSNTKKGLEAMLELTFERKC